MDLRVCHVHQFSASFSYFKCTPPLGASYFHILWPYNISFYDLHSWRKLFNVLHSQTFLWSPLDFPSMQGTSSQARVLAQPCADTLAGLWGWHGTDMHLYHDVTVEVMGLFFVTWQFFWTVIKWGKLRVVSIVWHFLLWSSLFWDPDIRFCKWNNGQLVTVLHVQCTHLIHTDYIVCGCKI